MTETIPEQPVDSLAFRGAMSRLGAAVNVITTDGDSGRHGFTASAVCSVTDSPPTVLVCVNRQSQGHDHVSRNGVLCVNVLAGGHADLSQRFATRLAEGVDRFDSGHDWSVLATGSPVLGDATASLDCRIRETQVLGSHTVFFCEVVALQMAQEQVSALIYFDRGYHTLGTPQSQAA